jgi:excisionase family DNA binding protein
MSANFVNPTEIAMPVRRKRPTKRRRLLTVAELAEYLRVHPTTIYRLLKREQIPGFKIGDSWRVSPEQIDRWLGENKKP